MSLAKRQKALLFFAHVYLLAAHPILTFQFVRYLKFLPNPGLPRRYHEKALWRKIVDRNPTFVHLSDKLAAKQIAKGRCPELDVAQVLWTGNDPRSLPANLLTSDVVVKTNHACATNLFIAEGTPDYTKIVTEAKRWLRMSYHRLYGEWAYRDIPRRIFVEEKLMLGGGDMPTDIKVHMFGNKIGHVWVTDKLSGRSRTYGADGAPLDASALKYSSEEPLFAQVIELAARLLGGLYDPRIPPEETLSDTPGSRALIAQAIELAPRLGGGLDYVRIDFMVAGARLHFGEFTLYPSGGYDRFGQVLTQRAEALWDLRRSYFLRKRHRGLARLYAEALRVALDQSAPSLS
jgi:hypothetical protein